MSAQRSTRRPSFKLAAWLYATTLLSLVVAVATLALVALPAIPDPRFLEELAHFVLERCEDSPEPVPCMERVRDIVPGGIHLVMPDGTVVGDEPAWGVECAEVDGHMGHLRLCLAPPVSPVSIAMALSFAGLTSLLSAWFLTRRFVRPMAELTRAARAVSAGDLRARTHVADDDAFGEVGRAFDTMVDDLRAVLDAEKELLASLSHELRTPLTRLSLALDVAGEGEPLDEAMLAGLRRDVSDLDELLKELLDAARLQLTEGRTVSPLGRVARTRIELGRWIAESVAAARERFPDSEISVALSGGDPPLLEGSERLLRRALRNLIENAARVSEPGSAVVVEAAWSDGKVYVRVVDRGPGIPEGDHQRMFAPFVRGQDSPAGHTGASAELGLGLTMVRRIAEGHAGSVKLEGREGGGTVATLTLPSA